MRNELIMINHHHDHPTDRQFPGHANPIAGGGAEEGQVCSTSCQGEDDQQPHKSSLLRIFLLRIFLLKIGFLRFFSIILSQILLLPLAAAQAARVGGQPHKSSFLRKYFMKEFLIFMATKITGRRRTVLRGHRTLDWNPH